MGKGRNSGESGSGMGRGGGSGAGQGAGRGSMQGNMPGTGPGGDCVCTSCGATIAHQRGVPCSSVNCPKCGSPMAKRLAKAAKDST